MHTMCPPAPFQRPLSTPLHRQGAEAETKAIWIYWYERKLETAQQKQISLKKQ